MTLAGVLADARTTLRTAGIPDDEAGLDARVLAQHLLGWDAARLLAGQAGPPPPGFADRYASCVARRAAREPVAYITGRREFWGLELRVTPDVLIPRPESEIIVEAALDLFPEREGAVRAADVGTGSGCLAIALAVERPGWTIDAVDRSAAALIVAARNAHEHGAAGRIRFLEGDLLEPLEGEYQIIVSNPPYVPIETRAALVPEVADHEPALALFGGAGGLTVIRRLVAAVPARLSPAGILIFEFGLGQADDVARLIEETGALELRELRQDLQGIPRTAIAGLKTSPAKSAATLDTEAPW
jgi:release factor glutamine methyltransferase